MLGLTLQVVQKVESSHLRHLTQEQSRCSLPSFTAVGFALPKSTVCPANSFTLLFHLLATGPTPASSEPNWGPLPSCGCWNNPASRQLRIQCKRAHSGIKPDA